jgi:hypothetical protein
MNRILTTRDTEIDLMTKKGYNRAAAFFLIANAPFFGLGTSIFI